MAALGRILQILGWLWVIAGFVGPRLDLPIPTFSVLPGIILIFIARALRRRARRQMPELPTGRPEPEPMPPERTLNTERQKTSPLPPRPVERELEPDPPRSDEDHNELLEKILGANEEMEKPATPTRVTPTRPDTKTPLTSAEMVAEARKRWDRKPTDS